MKASLLTFLCFVHTLFIPSFCTLVSQSHGRRHVSHRRVVSARSPSASMVDTRDTDAQADPRKAHERRADSLATIRDRRIQSILKDTVVEGNISSWLATLGPDGKWPDSEVDLTTGCPARRANWPAQDHWVRIVAMAAAWHGGVAGQEQYAQNEAVRAAASLAMDYWFKRDFPGTACLDSGGKDGCPCDNPNNYLWNTNWFSNVILIPEFVGEACLLLGNTVTPAQLQSAVRMTSRSYKYNVDGLTGANTLDVSRIGMDQALFTNDETLLMDAYTRSHKELVIVNGVKADGIRADGAFGQHDGMLYNGNYGKDYVNAILGIEIEAGGTEFAANAVSQAAFGTLFDGDRWMIFRNSVTGVLHWDFSALGRFISFPVKDAQATGSIKIDLATVGTLGRQWNSKPLIDFEKRLSKPTTDANAGSLVGNRMFYTNDYMVHRGRNYVSTIKMWSTRTRHTECTNSQNPLGFHLADGVSYTYLRGDEYEDIAAAWDWDLIPGITTDYGATPLTCENTKLLGLEAFVGGASNGKVGLSAMRYTNPVTKALHWQKAWFFLENDVQYVMVSDLSATSGKPVISVLDQRRRRGPVIVDNAEAGSSTFASAHSLWHGDVGYQFADSGAALTVQVGPKTGDWAKIGISAEPPVTVDLFAAYIQHQGADASSVSYAVFPGTSRESFREKRRQVRIQTVQSDVHISAIYDQEKKTFMAVFWDAAGGSVTFKPRDSAPITISVDGNVALIYTESGDITLSDPSQTLSSVRVTLKMGHESGPKHGNGDHGRGDHGKGDRTRSFDVGLPVGGLAGGSVTQRT